MAVQTTLLLSCTHLGRAKVNTEIPWIGIATSLEYLICHWFARIRYRKK